MPDTIAFTLDLTLADYVELRAFYQRRYVVRNSLVFFAFLVMGVLVIPPLSGLPVRLMLLVAERNWTYYATIIIGVFLLARLLPFLSIVVKWLRGKLPRQISIQAAEEGIQYALLDTDVLLHWGAISSVVATKRAYYINAKTRIVRLPKRDLALIQRLAFETLAAQHTKLKVS